MINYGGTELKMVCRLSKKLSAVSLKSGGCSYVWYILWALTLIMIVITEELALRVKLGVFFWTVSVQTNINYNIVKC